MKNLRLKKHYLFYFIITVIVSCDMQREMVTSLSKEQINAQYNLVRGECAALYNDLKAGYDDFGNGMEASICDEADLVNRGTAQAFNTGSWSQFNNSSDVLSQYYTAIRRINDFLTPSVDVDLEAYRLDPVPGSQTIYKERYAEIKNWKYEARFLRAFFYFELVKRYGGVAIIKEPLTLDTDFSTIKRDSLAKCIKFIVDECDSVSQDGALPAVYANVDNLGRATKGAALALKSRVLLYAASDLYNSPEKWAAEYQYKELISLPTADRRKRWQEAAKAAKAVIDLSEAGYGLESDYKFIGKSFNSKELIFVRRATASNSFEIANFPAGLSVGNGSVNPSQNMVDAYEMKSDGSAFDWLNSTQTQNPYANRDPRLEYSIFYNGSLFNKTTPLQIYEGGNNGKGIANATGTGYYLRKFIDESLDLVQGRTSVHTWVFFRIAEMYLNYAEALNECDPGNSDIITYVNKTRLRSSVNMPLITETNQDKVRERIRNERRIELAFEGHRLWDVRRWMTATNDLNQSLYGISCQYTNSEYQYMKVKVEDRVFDSKMYFYPIPQSLLFTTNNQWQQNPLW